MNRPWTRASIGRICRFYGVDLFGNCSRRADAFRQLVLLPQCNRHTLHDTESVLCPPSSTSASLVVATKPTLLVVGLVCFGLTAQQNECPAAKPQRLRPVHHFLSLANSRRCFVISICLPKRCGSAYNARQPLPALNVSCIVPAHASGFRVLFRRH
jgi:hypothetical protein